MTKPQALIVVFAFGLIGLAVAFWGLTDILGARRAMLRCDATSVIDNSAFYFLGLAVLPLFALLPLMSERTHTYVLAGVVALAILLPMTGYQFFSDTAVEQHYAFDPELTLFGLQSFQGTPGDPCTAQP